MSDLIRLEWIVVVVLRSFEGPAAIRDRALIAAAPLSLHSKTSRPCLSFRQCSTTDYRLEGFRGLLCDSSSNWQIFGLLPISQGHSCPCSTTENHVVARST